MGQKQGEKRGSDSGGDSGGVLSPEVLWGDKCVSKEDGPGVMDLAGRCVQKDGGRSHSDFDKFSSSGDAEALQRRNREKHPQASDPAGLI